jgi:hypothetical protein
MENTLENEPYGQDLWFLRVNQQMWVAAYLSLGYLLGCSWEV